MRQIVNSISRSGSKASLVQALRIHGAMPRSRLAEVTGLSRATISVAVAELMRAGLVTETDDRQATGGRPATNLELAAGTRAIIGADLDDQNWTVAAFDLLGNTLRMTGVAVPDTSAEAAIEALINTLPTFIQDLDISPVPLLGLGVPGLVDSENGMILVAADVGWTNVAMSDAVSEALGWPVVILNRHRARGLAECRFGAAKYHKEVIYVGVGTGIAAGVFVKGQLLPGAVGGAGEVGHATLDINGPLCSCGNRGCLQVMAAGPAIVQEVRRRIRSGVVSSLVPEPGYDIQLLRPIDVCKEAERGDALAAVVIEQAGDFLGVALANLVNILNPEVIVLGGSIPLNSPLYVASAERTMRQRAIGSLVAPTAITVAQLPEVGGSLGAANYVLDHHVAACLPDGSTAVGQTKPMEGYSCCEWGC